MSVCDDRSLADPFNADSEDVDAVRTLLVKQLEIYECWPRPCQLMVVAVLVNRGCAGAVGKVVPLMETPPQTKAVPVCSRLESIRCNEK